MINAFQAPSTCRNRVSDASARRGGRAPTCLPQRLFSIETPPGGPITGAIRNPAPVIEATERALERLQFCNEHFREGHFLHRHESVGWRTYLMEGQQPFATLLGCADSRIPPELIFDQGFGDLFVIRVAGNVIGEEVAGSLQYAVHHMRTPMLVVLGHEGCGAVTAAVQALRGRHDEPHYIEKP